MTVDEYMSAERFPLTAQRGLSAHQQFMMDAFNLDALRRVQEEGRPLDEEQQAILRELEEKERARPGLATS